MKILAVIPTYNESGNLPNLAAGILTLPLDVSILVVDDNSPDGTAEIANDLAKANPGRIFVLKRPGKLGLRSAYIEGFQKAFDMDFDFIVQMDADLSHDPIVMNAMAEKIKDYDVVIGSRYVPGGSVDQQWPLWRKALSAFGNFYARTILGFPLRDVTTGYRMWRKEALQNLHLDQIRATGYSFLVEMAYMAYLMKYRIAETPIYFANRQEGVSKMNLKIQLEAAIRIWEIRKHHRDVIQGK